MAKVTALKALTNFFQVEGGFSVESDGGPTRHTVGAPCVATVAGVPTKRAMKVWGDEVKALSPEEKRELAELVCAVTGDELSA